MNSSPGFSELLRTISRQALLERLFFASLELAVLALLMAIVVQLLRRKSPRLKALLWLLVMAKPIVSLAIGAPWHVVEFDVPIVDTDISLPSSPPGNDSRATTDADRRLSSSDGPAMQIAIEKRRGLGDANRESDMSDVDAREFALGLKLKSAAQTTVATTPHATNETGIMRSGGRVALFFWGAGIVVFVIRGMVDRIRWRRLIVGGHEPSDPIAAQYRRLAEHSGRLRLPRMIVTDDLESPALIGLLRPVILIPSWLTANASTRQLEWALRHELMHWKHRDSQAVFVRDLAQILFFFHPAAWWAARQWEEAAELACDRAIVTDEADSRDYAEQLYGMLVQVRDRRRMAVGSGLFATRTQIGRRIAALLGGPNAVPAHPSAWAIAVVFLFSAVTLCIGGSFAKKTDQPAKPAVASLDSTSDLNTPTDFPATGGKSIAHSPPADLAVAADNPREGTETTLRPASEKILRALGTLTSVNYQGLPLTEALSALGKYHKLEVRIDHDALQRAKIDPDAKVEYLRIDDGLSLNAVLNLLLEPQSLGYFADGDELVVTTRDKADSRIEETAYELRDVVRAGVSLADLAESIMKTTDRGTWDQPNGGAGRLRIDGTKLVVRQRADVQRHVQGLLVDVQRALVAVPGAFENDQIEVKSYLIADLRKGVSDPDLGNWLREALLVETSPENVGRADLTIEGDQMLLKQPPWVHAAATKYLANIRERGKREPTRQRTREDFSFVSSGLRAEALRRIIKKQLAKPVSADFLELPVQDTLSYFSEYTGVRLVINRFEWQKRGIRPDSPVTFKVVNEPLAALIDKSLTGLAVDWHVAEPGLILVAPQAQGAAALETRAYGIQDLCDRGHTVKGLMSLVKDLAPGGWAETGGHGSLRSLAPGLLLVSQTRSIHDQIDKMLDKLAPFH